MVYGNFDILNNNYLLVFNNYLKHDDFIHLKLFIFFLNKSLFSLWHCKLFNNIR